MSLPDFTMRQLLEAGAHFGHQSHRWNPKMAPYIYGARNSIHIIDLAQTVPLLHQALKARLGHGRQGRPRAVRRHQASGGRGGRRGGQALRAVFRQLAAGSGGTLTNWKTISASISRLRKLDEHARRRRQGPHQEGAPDADARAREAREGARRHQGHGRRARPRVRDRHQQGGAGDQGGQPPEDPGDRDPRHQLRSRRHRLSDSRRTTTRAARSSSIAISSRARRSTAFRAARAPRASTSARPRRRSPSRCRRPRSPRPRRDRAVRTAHRAARRAGRSGQAHRRRPADRQEAQRAWRVPLLAARRDDRRPRPRSSTPTCGSTGASPATIGSIRPAR